MIKRRDHMLYAQSADWLLLYWQDSRMGSYTGTLLVRSALPTILYESLSGELSLHVWVSGMHGYPLTWWLRRTIFPMESMAIV